jgi:transposase
MISRFDRSELPEVSVPSEWEEEMRTYVSAEQELTPYLMSVPGVGPNVVTAFLAYVGDGSRFATAGQVAAYAGLVPRVDCSGEAERYEWITKFGNPVLRR